MRRSRLTGRTKAQDTEFGWYFAGKSMDKRHSRGRRIRLIRYGPDMETCIHSRCPSPPPVPEKPICTCGCEFHAQERRSQSPSSSTSSGFEPGLRCKSCGGFHATKKDRSPQAEKPVCTCNTRCELHIREDRPRSPTESESSDLEHTRKFHCRYCRAERRELGASGMRPTTASSSDSSAYEHSRRHRGRRYTVTRESETSPSAERWHREVYTRTNTPATSTKLNSPRTSFTTAPPPLYHHHCHRAMYYEEHPELCRAFHSPVPKPTPTRTQSRQSSGKSHRNSQEKSTQRQPGCTCGRHLSPEHVSSPKTGSPKPAPKSGVLYCTCFPTERFFVDEPGYYTAFEDDTASETSMYAMPANDGDQGESYCPLYHRCRPRLERYGWVCGRK